MFETAELRGKLLWRPEAPCLCISNMWGVLRQSPAKREVLMKTPRRRRIAAIALATMLIGQVGVPLSSVAQSQGDNQFGEAQDLDTETSIKHVIVLIGENRTFDHVYGIYVPKLGQSVVNLLSKGIINADGSLGPHADEARQFQIGTIDPPSYFISTNKLSNPNKTAYTPFLPTPEAGGASPKPV